MLLPVLYKLVYSIPDIKHKDFNMRINNLVKEHTLDRFYDTGVDFVFRHKTASLIFIAITLPLCAFLFYEIPKSRMPEIDQNELIAHVEWNENIHIDENQSRVSQLFASIDNQVQEHTAYVGQQQFLLNRDREMSVSESEDGETNRNRSFAKIGGKMDQNALPDGSDILLASRNSI